MRDSFRDSCLAIKLNAATLCVRRVTLNLTCKKMYFLSSSYTVNIEPAVNRLTVGSRSQDGSYVSPSHAVLHYIHHCSIFTAMCIDRYSYTDVILGCRLQTYTSDS